MKKICLMLACVSILLGVIPTQAAEGLQKPRLAYASVTAAFAVPWITKEAGIFRRRGLDVEIVYIASGPRTIQTLIAAGVDVAALGGGSGIDAKLAGADTVFVGTAIKRKPADLFDNSFAEHLDKSGFLRELWGGEVR